MQHYLDAIPYGNRDMSAGLTTFWLAKSLEIDAEEQLRFIERLTRDDLPFSKRSMDIVKEILVLETTDRYVFRGKTGSARGSDRPGGQDLGWFVGYLTRGDRVYAWATHIEGKDAWGPKAREITKQILKELELM